MSAYVCGFTLCAHTVGTMELKFGTELVFHPEKVMAIVWARLTHLGGRGLYTGSRGPLSPNSAFLGKLYEKKLKSAHIFDQLVVVAVVEL